MLEAGRVVRSIAGHDKDSFYVIVSAAAGRIYIADGKARKLAKPKAKNPLHVSATSVALEPDTVTTDKKLRDALRAFNARSAEKEGGN